MPTQKPHFELTLNTAVPGSILNTNIRRKPTDFNGIKLTDDQRELVSRLAVSTFTAMANNGHTFESCLSAIYLTGFENGQAVAKEAQERKESGRAG